MYEHTCLCDDRKIRVVATRWPSTYSGYESRRLGSSMPKWRLTTIKLTPDARHGNTGQRSLARASVKFFTVADGKKHGAAGTQPATTVMAIPNWSGRRRSVVSCANCDSRNIEKLAADQSCRDHRLPIVLAINTSRLTLSQHFMRSSSILVSN